MNEVATVVAHEIISPDYVLEARRGAPNVEKLIHYRWRARRAYHALQRAFERQRGLALYYQKQAKCYRDAHEGAVIYIAELETRLNNRLPSKPQDSDFQAWAMLVMTFSAIILAIAIALQ